jgi:hypothetical protein
VVLAVHSEHDFVQVPLVPASRLSAPKGIGIGLPELERPLPDRFVADDHAPRSQQFFYITEAQCQTEVQPHGVADDLGRIAVAGVRRGFLFHG